VHAKAPAGQRGGWISAAKRKPYDATVIAPRLWIGSQPPFDVDLPRIDKLVLCAQELQPEAVAFHGQILRCPIPDAELDAVQVRTVAQAAVSVAKAIVLGQRVLVTCRMGMNRSALVVALALHQLTTMDSKQVVEHIRRQRNPSALSNAHFVAIIDRIVGDGRPKVRRRQPTAA
jgi:hypothetical protein